MLHRRGIKIHEKRVGRQMIQVVVLETRNVCGNLETSVAQFLVQPNVPRSTSPLEDSLDALANECLAVISTQATLSLASFDQFLGSIREHRALREERIKACAHGVVVVVGHQQRCEHPMFGARY